MRIYAFVVLLSAFGICGPSYAAELIKDSFNQMIDASLDAQVSLAREMRSPNISDKYNPEESVTLLQQIVEDAPGYYRGAYNLALSLYELDPEKPDAYLPSFQKAIEIEQSNPDVVDGSIYNTLGWIELNEQKLDSAESNLLKSYEYGDANMAWTQSAVSYNLGRLYFEKNEYDLALDYLANAVEAGNPAAITLKEIILEFDKSG